MLPEIIFELVLLGVTMFLALMFNSYWVFVVPVVGTLLILSSFISLYWAPFVPSANSKLETMIKLAKIKSGDRVYDLGAGNGKVVSAAAKSGAVATGYEISLPLVIFFFINKLFGRVSGQVLWGNFFTKDISDANTVFCYLFPHTVTTVSKKLFKQLKPGTKVISNGFQIKGLKPNKTENEVYLYIV